MVTAVRPAPWSKAYGETLTMSSSVQGLLKPPGAMALRVTSPTDFTMQLCPRLARAWKYVDSGGTYTDVTTNLSDKDTATTLSLNDLATADIVYLGCEQEFRGVYVDVGNTNSNAAVIDAEYWNGTAWTDLTETDGTISGGASLGQDGTITWTLPTDWAQTTVSTSPTLFWVRFKWDAALDATVTVRDAILLNKESNRGNFLAGIPHEVGITSNVAGIEAVESGGATLTATWLFP